MSRRQKNSLAKRKWWFIGGGLLAVAAVLSLFFSGLFRGNSEEQTDTSYMLAPVTEGSIASSTLLTGTVKALREEKIYYDASKGEIAAVYVNVGDKVTVGQHLMQYSTATAQANYDQAVRALNKVGRQINDLQVNGVPQTITDDEGNEVPNTAGQQTYQTQLQDLYDSYADAQLAVNKAQEEVNQTLKISSVEGTVVEVNTSVDPSKTGGQVVIHIVSEGQLQVEGSLTEYDLANLAVDQEVKMTSKVFPDKAWDGRISYISNYPAEAAAGTGGSANSANYPFKVDFVGDTSDLRQGFKVSIEVLNKAIHRLVPVEAVIPEEDKNIVWVYDKDSQKIKKVEVTLGRADAINQEVTAGLEPGQLVITNPSFEFQDGQTLPADKVTDPSQEGTDGQE